MIQKTFVTMTMPCTITIAENKSSPKIDEMIAKVKNRLREIDNTYSFFKRNSVISRFNRKEIKYKDLPDEAKKIFQDAEKTKKLSNGYFDIKRPDGQIDPSGLIKGWAILEGSKIIKSLGFKNFMIEIAGDIQTAGHPTKNNEWLVGIRNPFNFDEVIKVVKLSGEGIATSGTYMRGNHIYNPKKAMSNNKIVSLTVIGSNVFEADCFATAAFAMGRTGIEFIEKYPKLEGYVIDNNGNATFTSGFLRFVKND